MRKLKELIHSVWSYFGHTQKLHQICPACALIGQRLIFYQNIKHRKSVFY